MIGYAFSILIEVGKTRKRTPSEMHKVVERTASLFHQSSNSKVPCLLLGAS
jgi:hypothetical protein